MTNEGKVIWLDKNKIFQMFSGCSFFNHNYMFLDFELLVRENDEFLILDK